MFPQARVMKTADPVFKWGTPTASANALLCFNSLSFLAGARAGFLLDLFFPHCSTVHRYPTAV